MARILKFFVAGLPDAGKTTFVQTVSQIRPLETDVSLKGKKTTVAFDFGLLKLGEKYEIHVYGLPGQDRFSFILDIIKKGALGYVYLIPAFGYDLLDIITHYESIRKIVDLPHIVAITKADLKPLEAGDLLQITTSLGMDGSHILTIDPRNKIDVKKILERLIEKILSGFR